MSKLQYSPSELLSAFASPHGVSTKLPHLYFMNLSSPDRETSNFLRRTFIRCQASASSSGSGMFYLDSLTCSVLSLESFRSLATSVDLRCHSKYNSVDGDARRCIKALKSLVLRRFYLSPVDLSFLKYLLGLPLYHLLLL